MIEVGKTYTAKNQGRSITPQVEFVTVVWIENDNVHYRLNFSHLVKQTPLDRFLEIIDD